MSDQSAGPQGPTPPPVQNAGYAAYPPPPWWTNPPKRRKGWRWILRAVFITAFVLLLLLCIDLMILLKAGEASGLDSDVIREGNQSQVVAVYAVHGTISGQTSARFRRFLDVVRGDENIRAVVLRVDSPGGPIAPADRINRMIRTIRDELGRRVVVSMGGVAASGGYYISAPAETIFAEPTTVTGSIGVISVIPNANGLLEENGIDVVTIRSSHARRWKMGINYWEEPSPRIRENTLEMLNRMQAKFEDVVRAGRGNRLKITSEQVTMTDEDGKRVRFKEIRPFNGEVFVSEEAVQIGLVDEVGYLDDALDEAASLASLDEPHVVRYSPSRGLFERMGMVRSKSILDAEVIEDLTSPKILMLWKPE